MSMKSFKIQIPRTVLDDLQERLERTRWPDEIRGAGLGLRHEPLMRCHTAAMCRCTGVQFREPHWPYWPSINTRMCCQINPL